MVVDAVDDGLVEDGREAPPEVPVLTRAGLRENPQVVANADDCGIRGARLRGQFVGLLGDRVYGDPVVGSGVEGVG